MSKKNLTITFYVSEIMHDIRSKVYQLGKSVKATDKAELAAMLQDTQDEDADILLRSMTTAYGSLKNHLSEYMNEADADADDVMIEEKENTEDDYQTLDLILDVPSNFNFASREAIATNAHDYIVEKAISQWLEYVNLPQKAGEIDKQAEASLAMVTNAVCKRVRPSRTKIDTSSNKNGLKYE